jgi:hypothetical protein
MSSTRARRPSPGRIDLIRLPRTPTHDINVENNNPSVRASLERHASFEDAESFTVLAQRETEAALSRHLQQEEQLARFRNATRERLEASCVKYDEVDVKQEALSRRQVGHPCFVWRISSFHQKALFSSAYVSCFCISTLIYRCPINRHLWTRPEHKRAPHARFTPAAVAFDMLHFDCVLLDSFHIQLHFVFHRNMLLTQRRF